MNEHRWSGWPGAYCLDCGIEDPMEVALANGDVEFCSGDEITIYNKEKYDFSSCKEHMSNRCNPSAQVEYFNRKVKENSMPEAKLMGQIIQLRG